MRSTTIPVCYIQSADGEQYAAVRVDELGTNFELIQSATNARGLTVGAILTLEHHTRDDQNRDYLITGASYDLSFEDYESLPEASGTGYRCAFVAMPAAQQFRPKRITPKPFVQGPQTAVVVGPGGEEIYTDKYGRVKVQFHWDRRGKKDENSSCWIRVSHPWAGKNWGAIATPRIGQEVIVDFLEGDPDQPIITGRVYNAEQMPPYDLPANMTQSGVKSRSSKGGGPANFNEIRMEDKKGSEQLFIHAEKNQDIEVENDETHWVGHDRTKTIDHDETSHIKHDRTETVDNNETITVHGQRTETVDKNETITINLHRSETVNSGEDVTVNGSRVHTVNGPQTTTISLVEAHTVGGARAHTVGAAEAITLEVLRWVGTDAAQMVNVGAVQSTKVGAARSVTVGSAQTVKVASNATMTIGGDEGRDVKGGRGTSVGKDDTLKVAKNLVLDAGDSIALRTGDASITLKKDGTVQISGKDIIIIGTGKISVKADADVVIKGSAIKQN